MNLNCSAYGPSNVDVLSRASMSMFKFPMLHSGFDLESLCTGHRCLMFDIRFPVFDFQDSRCALDLCGD